MLLYICLELIIHQQINYFPFLSPLFFVLLLLLSFFISTNNQIHIKCLYMTSSLPGAGGPCWSPSPSGSHPGGETASRRRWVGSYSIIKALLALLRGTRNVKPFCSVSLRTTLQQTRSKLVLPQKQVALLPCLDTSPWKTFSVCSVFIHDIRTIPSVSFHVSFLSSQIKSNENLRIYEKSLLLTLIGNPELPSAMTAAAAAKSLQSCPTLCDPTDGSPPGSPVPGILQARTPEWVAISFSNAWKGKVKVKSLSHVRPLATPWTVIQAGLFWGKKEVIISLAPAHHCLSYTWFRALTGIYYLLPPLIIVYIVYANIRFQTPWHQGVDFWAVFSVIRVQVAEQWPSNLAGH